MENKLTIYYSVENCGDGSARPRLYDTEKLAKWHQNHLNEGWGEPCTGTIDIQGNNLSCSNMQTKEGYYLSLLLDDYPSDDNELKEFIAKFFPDGLPKFSVDIYDENNYGIYLKDKLVHIHFAYPEKNTNTEGVKKLTKTVNS